MSSTDIGLLLCDHLDTDVAELVGDLSDLFSTAFEPAGMKLRIYEVAKGELPASPAECRGWIISGSRLSAYDDVQWIEDLSDFIVTAAAARAPQVGVCFGHQLIAQALGGRVERAEVGWGVGAKEFQVVEAAKWMTPAVDRFRLLMSHQDQVVELPSGAEVIASAPYCPVGAYSIGSHVFSVQGHPEFTPALNRLLIQKRRERLGEAVADEAIGSLDQPLDHGLLVEWVSNFFASESPEP